MENKQVWISISGASKAQYFVRMMAPIAIKMGYKPKTIFVWSSIDRADYVALDVVNKTIGITNIMPDYKSIIQMYTTTPESEFVDALNGADYLWEDINEVSFDERIKGIAEEIVGDIGYSEFDRKPDLNDGFVKVMGLTADLSRSIAGLSDDGHQEYRDAAMKIIKTLISDIEKIDADE